MKALCLVAHPDDCVIFAYSYIYNHPEHDWTIGYLTYTAADPRGREMAEFWQRRGIECIFLGYVDDYQDIENQKISFDTDLACEDLQALADKHDLVLTHDQNGDYGHIHHVLVHHSVQWHPHLVTFAQPGEGTTYTVPDSAYSLDELPIHANIIAGFHIRQHQNSYKEPL